MSASQNATVFVSTCLSLKTFPILVLRCINILVASIPMVIPSVSAWAFRFAEACALRDDPSILTQVESEKKEEGGTKHDWILNTLLGEFDFCIYLGTLARFFFNSALNTYLFDSVAIKLSNTQVDEFYGLARVGFKIHRFIHGSCQTIEPLANPSSLDWRIFHVLNILHGHVLWLFLRRGPMC